MGTESIERRLLIGLEPVKGKAGRTMGISQRVQVQKGWGVTAALQALWGAVQAWFADLELPEEPTPGRNGRLFGYHPVRRDDE